MNRSYVLAILVSLSIAAPVLAAPILTVTPQGLQSGNWVWDVAVSPDLVLAGTSDTPLNVELGFRLTGTPLVSVTNVNSPIFDTNNPSTAMFGWEVSYGFPAKPEGIQANCASCTVVNSATLGGHAATVVPGTANEIFTAMGSIDTSLPGPIPFLRIVGRGPGNGGSASSTIEWLGPYGGKGRISQIVGGRFAENFDIYAGSLTQVPEPATAMLMLGGIAGLWSRSRRRWHR